MTGLLEGCKELMNILCELREVVFNNMRIGLDEDEFIQRVFTEIWCVVSEPPGYREHVAVALKITLAVLARRGNLCDPTMRETFFQEIIKVWNDPCFATN